MVGKLGLDLNHPAFWQQGISEIETLIESAEQLAEAQ
jgi:hypothetical protein